MPKLKHRPPSYSLHKASGQAVVKIDGRSRYLGKYGSPERHSAYRRLTAEWAAGKGPIPTPQTAPEEIRADLRVNQLLVAYLDFAEGYYVKNGRPTGEFRKMKDAIRLLQEIYKTTLVWEFSEQDRWQQQDSAEEATSPNTSPTTKETRSSVFTSTSR